MSTAANSPPGPMSLLLRVSRLGAMSATRPQRSPRPGDRGRRPALLIVLSAALVVTSLPAGASDTTVRWESFSESPECNQPYTRPPMVSRSGSLPNNEPILGPYGTYFGRSITQVRSRLSLWTVPGSGGQRILVHKAALPAFQRVAAGLAAEAAAGRVYRITRVSAFASRTVGGTYQISRHALATAIDINYPQNPYRADGKLITDMPDWFVQVWRDAGFCWGGDWRGSKDSMHFSWIGPKATPTTGDVLKPIPPITASKAFGAPVVDVATLFAPILDRYDFITADGDGNASPDVVGLRSHPGGAVLDIALGARGFGSCSIARFFVPDSGVTGAEHTLFVDIDGDSRQDLVTINGSQALVATRRADYQDPTVVATSLDPEAVAVTGGDFDGDHRADLWEVSANGVMRVYGGDSWNVLLHQQDLPAGAPVQIAVGDRDGGNLPEVFALYPSGGSSRVDVLRLNGTWQLVQAVPITVPSARWLRWERETTTGTAGPIFRYSTVRPPQGSCRQHRNRPIRLELVCRSQSGLFRSDQTGIQRELLRRRRKCSCQWNRGDGGCRDHQRMQPTFQRYVLPGSHPDPGRGGDPSGESPLAPGIGRRPLHRRQRTCARGGNQPPCSGRDHPRLQPTGQRPVLSGPGADEGRVRNLHRPGAWARPGVEGLLLR